MPTAPLAAKKPKLRELQQGDRRATILRALYKCIKQQGYSKTSLTDISMAAGMSPSHIRYYFGGKEAVLEEYFRQACEAILEGIHRIPEDDPERWFQEFVDYFISNPWITRQRLSVMVEIFGIAVHDPVLREIKARYDREIRTILQRYFEQVGCAEGVSPPVAAEVAQSL
jgi:AcrR family transcriptional regulator